MVVEAFGVDYKPDIEVPGQDNKGAVGGWCEIVQLAGGASQWYVEVFAWHGSLPGKCV